MTFNPQPKIKSGKKKQKVKRPTVSSEKKKAWDACSVYIRTRDALETTGTIEFAICCTCGKPYPAFGKGCLQAGHYIPGRMPSILFDERGIHAQCYNCNIRLKGNPIKYRKFMEKKHGWEVINELESLSETDPHYKVCDYQDFREKFKNKTKKLLAPSSAS